MFPASFHHTAGKIRVVHIRFLHEGELWLGSRHEPIKVIELSDAEKARRERARVRDGEHRVPARRQEPCLERIEPVIEQLKGLVLP